MQADAQTRTDAPPAGEGSRFARQVILDARNAIHGYELTDVSGAPPGLERDAALLAHARLLLASKPLAERRVLVLPCSLASLSAGWLQDVDPQQLVLAVDMPQGLDAAGIEQGAGQLAAMKAQGLRILLGQEALSTGWRPWLQQADYLKLDVQRLPAPALPSVVKLANAAKVRVVAGSVHDPAKHADLLALGVDLFQGSWYAKPKQRKGHKLDPNQAVILELVALLRREADTAEIEELLKRDPGLSFNLLKFINSGAFGLATEITSFRSAVMMVGMQRLLRWATVLLATSRSGAPALGYTAVVRGRLMELLALELLTPEQCDQAFVVGVFSLLDAMTGVPMEQALEGLALPSAVTDALLHRRGLFQPFLALTEACEGANDDAFARYASELLLSGHQVNMAHLQSLAWAEELLAA